ncbi:hypothetical protein SAMD00019534_088180 [Acytostelium subglobosum LB1]|uniref:hypothetical protein n=1 Tax=Acytostelium subglobosum LB1 TaxID=1410327 RepID=UPI000644A654|nr:hypothetical protein SAMD00019534_088180 [Acytostelium subglobosum LB1]GAM25643.1 hypothetical protein SAMD00019534_088180 [Acytostelium subglobosum LB1]|eukprot:XP_012751629.1 hypothetical protein SAMD00019534_088180 [Acytostelium subglobosum LB1]
MMQSSMLAFLKVKGTDGVTSTDTTTDNTNKQTSPLKTSPTKTNNNDGNSSSNIGIKRKQNVEKEKDDIFDDEEEEMVIDDQPKTRMSRLRKITPAAAPAKDDIFDDDDEEIDDKDDAADEAVSESEEEEEYQEKQSVKKQRKESGAAAAPKKSTATATKKKRETKPKSATSKAAAKKKATTTAATAAADTNKHNPFANLLTELTPHSANKASQGSPSKSTSSPTSTPTPTQTSTSSTSTPSPSPSPKKMETALASSSSSPSKAILKKDDRDDKVDDKEEDDVEDAEEEIEEEEIEEEIEEEEEEEEDGKIVKKVVTKFIRKQVVSKLKGSAKMLEQELLSLSKYDPIKDAPWKKGQSTPYMALAKTFERIESTSRRLLIIEHLANLFRSVMLLSPQDLVTVIYLSINKIGPSYGGKELGIGESILIKAVSETTGRTVDSIKQEIKDAGDLGIVSQSSRTTQSTLFASPPLTIKSVFKTLEDIASLTGNSSQNKKKDLIKKMLVACKESEALYIIRSLQGKLRIGLAEGSVLTALSRAFTITPPGTSGVMDVRKTMTADEFQSLVDKNVARITRAYSQTPNYDILVPLLCKENGVDTILETCKIKVGVPVKPMLAQPTNGITQVLDRFQGLEFTCEYKYDGERVQIHRFEDGTIKIYTRNLEDYTPKYPDIIANVPKFIGDGINSFILDCEAVAMDPSNGKILPFQVLSSRPRKGVTLDQVKVPVCVFAFDLLYVNGQSLIDEQLCRRREVMNESFKVTPNIFQYAQFANVADVDEIQAYVEEAVKANCEGLMVKDLP